MFSVHRGNFGSQFLKKQEKRIQTRIEKYNDPERIKEELKNGGLSDYTKYKQKNLVPKLRKALHKIHTNQYGYCEKCNQPIEIKRLEIIPAAEHCLKCIKVNNS
ncbi:MAG TPA: TraR/DksA C4-type zinc finger protein [Patescibacteria group bacterium]|nr:TraR/DksA C4-type zinc finger protein [Patescibacteria group bacterium]